MNMERSDVRKARMEREGHASHWDPAVAELIDSAKADAEAERDRWREAFYDLSRQFDAAGSLLGLTRVGLLKALNNHENSTEGAE